MDGPKFHLSRRDAVAWLGDLPSESVDLVITDPPYESLEKYRAIGTTTRLKHSKSSSNDWFSIFPNARFPELFQQVYRVLKKNAHFYLYCDPETMFVAKPLAEAVGFKFWKPLVWDKCLGPDTPVWTARGVRRIEEVRVGDRVALPDGGTTSVIATRRTRASALSLALSDGTAVIASRDHRFVRADGRQLAAAALQRGDQLATRPIRERYATHAHEVSAYTYVGGAGEFSRRRAVPPPVVARPIEIVGIEEIGDCDLVDISVAHPDELFLLANGVVTHNCSIGMGYHYRARYENILFFEKGKRKLANLGISDIITHKRITGGYPAEKPSAVSEVLIQQSSERGEIVIDPFMGSGSVGVAAVGLGRAFAGNDLCAEAVQISQTRLVTAGGDARGAVREVITPPAGRGKKPAESQLGLDP